jgi:hypothetical protein
LREQLGKAGKQASHRPTLAADLKELKQLRQTATKARTKRTVPILSTDRTKFKHRSEKKDGLDHPIMGVEAAVRYSSNGSMEKAIVLLKATIKRLGIRCDCCVLRVSTNNSALHSDEMIERLRGKKERGKMLVDTYIVDTYGAIKERIHDRGLAIPARQD